MQAIQKNKNNFILLTIPAFGILYSLIALVNHYNFRTYALDLGAYTNALFDYSRFSFNDSTVFKEQSENLLADHFDLYLPAFSMLRYIFGTWTLLLVQIVFILVGALGLYRYILLRNDNPLMARLATISFLSFFGVFSAVAFDYHSNVVAAMILPWFFYYVHKKNIKIAFPLLILIMLGKENMSFWCFFIALGLLLEYRKEKELRLPLMSMALLSLFYFTLITQWIMPGISNSGAYPHFQYSVLGNSMSESLINAFSHPFQYLKLLFLNHHCDESLHGVKREVHLLTLASGMFLLLFRPGFLIMLIPIVAQKMYHDNPAMWSLSGQYCIEYTPVLYAGVFTLIAQLNTNKIRLALGILVLAGTVAATVRSMDRTSYFTNKNKIRFYQSGHYSRDYDVKKVHALIRKIPPDEIISVQSPFLPHLSLRDKIYQFPIIKDAGMVLYSLQEAPYPLDTAAFHALHLQMMQDPEWLLQEQTENCFLFKRQN